MSLFDGYLTTLPQWDPVMEDCQQYCNCQSLPVCGGSTVSDNISNIWEPNQPIRPNVPKIKVVTAPQTGRRRRRSTSGDNVELPRTDNIDYKYNSDAFNYTASGWNVNVSFTWPTQTGITQQQALSSCQSTIWNNNPLSTVCSSFVPVASRQSIVAKCVDDVQVCLQRKLKKHEFSHSNKI